MFGFFKRNTFSYPGSKKLNKKIDKINKVRTNYLDYCNAVIDDVNSFTEELIKTHDEMIDAIKTHKKVSKDFDKVYKKYSDTDDEVSDKSSENEDHDDDCECDEDEESDEDENDESNADEDDESDSNEYDYDEFMNNFIQKDANNKASKKDTIESNDSNNNHNSKTTKKSENNCSDKKTFCTHEDKDGPYDEYDPSKKGPNEEDNKKYPYLDDNGKLILEPRKYPGIGDERMNIPETDLDMMNEATDMYVNRHGIREDELNEYLKDLSEDEYDHLVHSGYMESGTRKIIGNPWYVIRALRLYKDYTRPSKQKYYLNDIDADCIHLVGAMLYEERSYKALKNGLLRRGMKLLNEDEDTSSFSNTKNRKISVARIKTDEKDEDDNIIYKLSSITIKSKLSTIPHSDAHMKLFRDLGTYYKQMKDVKVKTISSGNVVDKFFVCQTNPYNESDNSILVNISIDNKSKEVNMNLCYLNLDDLPDEK